MLVCREFTFDAAHRLTEYKGKCERLHGHTYRLRVCIEEPVGENGLAFDFTDLKRIVNERVIDILDHSDLNAVFDQPSAENIALWIWGQLADELSMAEIVLWESPDSFVVYRGEEHVL
jgi:6-pyruvoyltetrahydropterin/6-carboxytetrahydropterin synthase